MSQGCVVLRTFIETLDTNLKAAHSVTTCACHTTSFPFSRLLFLLLNMTLVVIGCDQDTADDDYEI